MKLGLSNIALTQYTHESELIYARDLGFSGLEVAPSRVWPDTWHGLKESAVKKYFKLIERAGFKVIGLHSLFYDQKSLGLFTEGEQRFKTLDF